MWRLLMLNSEMDFPVVLVKKIVQCIEDAVSDDILTDIRKNDLRTRNSIPFRIWDLINTSLIKELEPYDCAVAIAHSGPWGMAVIFEKSTNCIFTFMREQRFSFLRKNQRYRNRMHYLDMLSSHFNNELLSDQQQLALYPHTFPDANEIGKRIQQMLHDLQSDVSIVRHHVLVLFNTSGYRLTNIRAVKITPNLDIAKGCDANWSQYITARESSVVEKVENPASPENNPNRGLKLKPKAIERQKRMPKRRIDQNEQASS